jgi:hypothetical protein
VETLILGLMAVIVVFVGYALAQAWRHVMRQEDAQLPIYGMLQRQGARTGDMLELAQAARRCAFCDLADECRHRLQTGAPLPADCRNAELFARVSRPAA